MNKVNRILTTNIKSGLVRDLDEEKWSDAYEQATEELQTELDRTPTDREINCRACEVLGRKK